MRYGTHKLDDPARRRRFLDALREFGLQSIALARAGIGQQTLVQYVDANPWFALEVQEALADLGSRLMGRAREFAMEGVVESEKYDPKTGEVIERKYRISERVFLAWVRAVLPEMREQYAQMEAAKPATSESVTVGDLAPETQRKLRDALQEATAAVKVAARPRPEPEK